MDKLKAISVIDYCYYQIGDIAKKLDSRKPIHKMIDNATGFEKEQVKALKDLVLQVIEAKKEIEMDFSGDQEFLDNLNQILETNKPNE